MPNVVAYAALLIWPVVSLFLFLALPLRRAIIWSILGGYLVLPIAASFDFPGVPSLDKSSIPNLVVLLLTLAFARRADFRWPRNLTINLLIAAYILVPFLTGYFNRDPVMLGIRVLPAMDLYSSLASASYAMLNVLPFIVGASALRDERCHRDLLVIMVMAALAYSLPILAEIRLSPFLARDIYGIGGGVYFVQQMRDGGFRAPVFLGHGLLVSTFLAMSIVAAVGLWRMRRTIWSIPAGLVVAYLVAVLILNKSSGAIILTVLIAPAVYLLRPKRFLAFGLAGALVIMSYPALRGMDLIPTSTLSSLAGKISPARQQSLDYRFQNEDMLLARANERPFFGWGGFARSRVFVVNAYGGAQDVSVTDGTWVIAIGTTGWLGYIALFGLLCYPFWRGFKLRRHGVSMASVALLAMHLLNLIDLLPNSSLRPLTWLVAGALSNMVAVGAVQGDLVSRAKAVMRPRPWEQPQLA